MHPLTVVLILACLLWLAALSFYARQKLRSLFQRQSNLRQEIGEIKSGIITPLRLDVAKHKRLLELNASEKSAAGLPYRFTAQFGEDVAIYDFFKNQEPGFFVEAGAYDGITFSNTYLLETIGWRGLLVEPHPRIAETCARYRPNSIVEQKALGPEDSSGTVEFTCADDPRGGAPLSFLNASEEHIERCKQEECTLEKVSVELRSLNSLLESRTERVEFFSLDVEGMEMSVLQGFDIARFQPEVILIELNWTEEDKVVGEYLNAKGYESAGVVGCNSFFTRQPSVQRLKTIIDSTFN